MNHLRFALRQLIKNPGFTAVAVITLALGIGANTAIFSVINAVLLKPLPYREPQKLVRIFEYSEDQPHFPMSPADFLEYRDQNSSLSGLAVYMREDLELSQDDRPERLTGMRITQGFFDSLGVKPLLGREFRREEEQVDDARVVILSHALWQRRFHADSQIVGKTIPVSGKSCTVVGVMPAGLQNVGGDYRSLPYGETVDVWWPFGMKPESWEGTRGSHFVNAIGRLKPGFTGPQAAADFNIIADRLAQQHGENKGWHINLRPLHDEIVGKSSGTLLVLQAAVVFVLLIACVNLASLMMVRAVAREREIAVRTALGAGRARLIRQTLAESLLLSLLGGAAGLLLASLGIKLLIFLAPTQLPRLQATTIDGSVLFFTLGVSTLTGILFGLAPTLQSIKININDLLKDGGRGTSGGIGKRRLRDGLAILEVALALVLLVGAGLLLRSFQKLQHIDAGFNPTGVLTATVNLPPARYKDSKERATFCQQFIARLEALPGVSAAGLSSDLPWTGYDENTSLTVEGKTSSTGGFGGRYHRASSGYFRAIGTPLVAGRFFNSGDTIDSRRVLLINERMAQTIWPGESPLGKRIGFQDHPKENEWLTIVGVVGDVKDTPEASTAVSALYMPPSQIPSRELFLALKTEGDPMNLVGAVRRELSQLDKDLPMADIQPLNALAGAAIASQRFTLLLTGMFALTALALAAVGVYGVMSYLVAQRSGEVGIRMALGAQRSDVLHLILRHGMFLAAVGTLTGLAGALGLAQLTRSLLFGVGPTDPVALLASPVLLGSVILLACWIPARRAANIDPVVALKSE